MEEKKLSEKESLEVIATMIARTRQRYLGDGNIMLMWGYLVVAVAALVWIMLAATHCGAWSWLWFAIPVIGGVATPLMVRRQKRVVGAVTYSDKIMSRLWTVVGVSEFALALLCFAFAALAQVNCWIAMMAYSIVVVPVAEIAQGLVVRESSLTVGGIVGLSVGLLTMCCVAGGVPLAASWFMPLFMVAFAAMMIVPGHIINHKARHE